MADSPENNADGPLGITITVGGSPLADVVQVMSIRVTSEVNRIPEATFVILADSQQIDDFSEIDSDAFDLGNDVVIEAWYGRESAEELFRGIILSTRFLLDDRDGLRMEVTCRDKAVALTEVRSSVPYADVTDSDIMTEIIKNSRAGLTGNITATTQKSPLNLRVEATDWDFLRLLADRNGFVLTVQGATITAKEPDLSKTEVLQVSYGMDIYEIDISIDAHRMISKAQTVSWSEQTQEVVTGTNEQFPTPTFGSHQMADVARVLNNREQMAATAREFEAADLNVYAKSRLERASLAIVHGTVKFLGCGKIHPADMLMIADTGARFGGKGYVSGVLHVLEAGEWTTRVRLGLPQDWTTDVHGVATPSAAALTAPIHGLQIGKVLAVAEDPAGKQRIKVSLPLIGDPAAEVWARFASPYASAEAGFQFLPEVDDEVVVAFLNADPNAPVIVGSLHNNVAKRPLEAEEPNNFKTIVTRENLKVTFDDDQKIITVETPGGHKLTMDDAASAFSMQDMNGNSIVMDAAGITLKSDNDITITATGNVAVEATADTTVKGNNVTCEGGIGFTGKGGANAELSAGGQTKVEGAMVMIN